MLFESHMNASIFNKLSKIKNVPYLSEGLITCLICYFSIDKNLSILLSLSMKNDVNIDLFLN